LPFVRPLQLNIRQKFPKMGRGKRGKRDGPGSAP